MKIIMLAAIEAKCFNVNMIKQGLVSKRRVKPKKKVLQVTKMYVLFTFQTKEPPDGPR